MGGRGGSPREGSSHHRQRSPPGFRDRSRSPILYARQMSRDGRSRTPPGSEIMRGWRGSRSPPWPPRSRSSERQTPPPRRSHDRRGSHRRSPDRRSPARWSPDRRGSPFGRRIQSPPERRGPSLERRGSSEARRLSPLGGPRLHPSPPQRSRSRERDWSKQGGWSSRGGHTRPPPSNFPNRGGRTYNARPGPGPGRYNSQLDPRHAERPVEQRHEDFVCK